MLGYKQAELKEVSISFIGEMSIPIYTSRHSSLLSSSEFFTSKNKYYFLLNSNSNLYWR